jgi:hypothetical protein
VLKKGYGLTRKRNYDPHDWYMNIHDSLKGQGGILIVIRLDAYMYLPKNMPLNTAAHRSFLVRTLPTRVA